MSDKSILSMVGAAGALFGGSSDTLTVGDPAPDFVLHGSDGATHRLDQYKGKQ